MSCQVLTSSSQFCRRGEEEEEEEEVKEKNSKSKMKENEKRNVWCKLAHKSRLYCWGEWREPSAVIDMNWTICT